MTEQTRRAYQQQQTFDNNTSHQFDRLDFQSVAVWKGEYVRLLWYVRDDQVWLEMQYASNQSKYITLSLGKTTTGVWYYLLYNLEDNTTFQPLSCKCVYRLEGAHDVYVKIYAPAAKKEDAPLLDIKLSYDAVEALHQVDEGINEALKIHFKEE